MDSSGLCTHTTLATLPTPHFAGSRMCIYGLDNQEGCSRGEVTDLDLNGTPDLGWPSKNSLELTCPGN